MKKRIFTLIFLMLLGGNNLNASLSDTAKGFGAILFLTGGVLASPVLSLAPSSFKDEDIYYSRTATLSSTLLTTMAIPFGVILATKGNESATLSSVFIAPFVGMYLGYSFSKTKDPLIAIETEKKAQETVIWSLVTAVTALGLTLALSQY